MENDLISRRAVLELPRNVERTLGGKVVSETVDVKLIEALSTIAARERGYWKPQNISSVYGYNPAYSNYNPDIYHCCSKCGADAIVDDCGDELLSDFCYNCGADMREEDDSEP